MSNTPEYYVICKHTGAHSPGGSEFFDYWNHETQEWQRNDATNCRYSNAAEAHDDLGKTECKTAWVGNQWHQAVDKDGKLQK